MRSATKEYLAQQASWQEWEAARGLRMINREIRSLLQNQSDALGSPESLHSILKMLDQLSPDERAVDWMCCLAWDVTENERRISKVLSRSYETITKVIPNVRQNMTEFLDPREKAIRKARDNVASCENDYADASRATEAAGKKLAAAEKKLKKLLKQ
jgi:vacuolar-type H+-ATPase subunit H